jgi:diguanylate cyclase (GGDEF)-like protein
VTVALVAIGAALGAILLLLLSQWIVRRSGSDADERVTAVVRELEARMDEMVRELTGALEQAQVEGQRNRQLGELAGTIDLDEVLTRVLETAGAIPGADAALVTLSPSPAGDGQPIVATLGLSAEEAERQAVNGPPDGREARAISISYEYSTHEEQGTEDAIRSGVAVPLPGETGPLGLLTIFTRQSGHRFGEEETRELEELAIRAGPAIENARRFREARQLADLDALTGLHNRRYFHETLAREVARAHRYQRNLALVIFDLDDFKAINDRIGHLAGDGVLAEAAERVRDVVRSADIACRVGGDEFAVILPESQLGDADQLYRRLQKAVASRPLGEAGALNISAGVAELRPDDDSISFFQRADNALYGAKEGGKGQVVAASMLKPEPSTPTRMPPTAVPPPEETPGSNLAG